MLELLHKDYFLPFPLVKLPLKIEKKENKNSCVLSGMVKDEIGIPTRWGEGLDIYFLMFLGSNFGQVVVESKSGYLFPFILFFW